MMMQSQEVVLGPRQCINCGSLLLADSIFCHRCGIKQPSPKLILQLEDEDEQLEPFVLEDAGIKHVIGRTIEPLEHFVQIDLSPYRGKEQGVSRSHAEIWFDQEQFAWQLRDIGSQFGTFVDENQLEEGQAVTLAPSQRLRFGGITISVTLEF